MRKVLPAFVAILLLAAVAALMNWPAVAQVPTHEVFVATDVNVDPNTSGVGTLPIGTNDGVLGVDCQGNSPLGGTSQTPAQVITELRATQIALRILGPQGTATSAPVQLNCTVDVDTTVPTATQRIKAALR